MPLGQVVLILLENKVTTSALEKTIRVLVISKREESQERKRIEKRRRVASLGLKITLQRGLDLGNIYVYWKDP
jgi:hypothetical protein